MFFQRERELPRDARSRRSSNAPLCGGRAAEYGGLAYDHLLRRLPPAPFHAISMMGFWWNHKVIRGGIESSPIKSASMAPCTRPQTRLHAPDFDRERKLTVRVVLHEPLWWVAPRPQHNLLNNILHEQTSSWITSLRVAKYEHGLMVGVRRDHWTLST